MEESDGVRIDGTFLPLHQLLDYIEGNDDVLFENGVAVTLLPPTKATDVMTDEDSGDESNVNIDNVPPSQINAPALLNGMSFTPDEIEPSEPEEPEPEPSTSGRQVARKRKGNNNCNDTSSRASLKRNKTQPFKWKMSYDLQNSTEEWQPMITVPNSVKTPSEYFEIFFDEDVILMMVTYTNQYAAKRNRLGDCSINEN